MAHLMAATPATGPARRGHDPDGPGGPPTRGVVTCQTWFDDEERSALAGLRRLAVGCIVCSVGAALTSWTAFLTPLAVAGLVVPTCVVCVQRAKDETALLFGASCWCSCGSPNPRHVLRRARVMLALESALALFAAVVHAAFVIQYRRSTDMFAIVAWLCILQLVALTILCGVLAFRWRRAVVVYDAALARHHTALLQQAFLVAIGSSPKGGASAILNVPVESAFEVAAPTATVYGGVVNEEELAVAEAHAATLTASSIDQYSTEEVAR